MKRENKQLSFLSLVAIASAGAIAGIFSSIGLATEQTGRSAWIAYALAVFAGGLLRATPTLAFTSMFRFKGGSYAMAAMTKGPLAGGIYALWWLPMFLSRGATASALGQYIHYVFPQISPAWIGILLTTLVFVVNLFGLKAVSKLQRPLTALTVVAVAVFTVFGLTRLQPGAFSLSSPEYFSGGGMGLLLAVTLVIQPTSAPLLLCGFSWDAKDAKRSIPLAILAGLGAVFLLFVCVSFVAANAIPVSLMAGKNITFAAEQILPGILFPLFLFFGPVLALCASLNSTMGSFAAPVQGAVRDGWLPEKVGLTNKHGSPWVIYTAMWLICVIPMMLGVSLKTFIAYTVMTQRICALFMLVLSYWIPGKFPKQWKSSFLHVPNWVYYILLTLSVLTEAGILISSVLAASLSMLIGNLLVAAVLAGVAVYRYKAGKTHVHIVYEE